MIHIVDTSFEANSLDAGKEGQDETFSEIGY